MREPTLHKKNQRGQAIVLIAALMVALIAALGLAIDGGGMFLLYRDVQNATDAAGLSAAFALCTGDNPENAVLLSTELNGFLDTNPNVTIEVENPPTTIVGIGSPYYNNDAYVAIRITAVKPSYFIQIVYDGPLQVSATTTAQCSAADDFGLPPESALVTLKHDTSCNPVDAGVWSGGNSATSIIGSVFTNDPQGCTAFRNAGNSEFVVTGKICSDGTIEPGAVKIPGSTIAATTKHPCDEVGIIGTDPLGIVGNEPTCDRSVDLGPLSNYAGGTAPAGYYSDFTSQPGQTIILGSGIYCTDHSINLKGNTTSDDGGVTIFMDCDCTFTTNATGKTDLFAQESGPYAGLLFYTNSTNKNMNQGMKFNGQAGLKLSGTIYAPEASCSIKGGNDTIIYAQFICYDYHTAGDTEVVIYYLPSAVYKKPPSFGLTQ